MKPKRTRLRGKVDLTEWGLPELDEAIQKIRDDLSGKLLEVLAQSGALDSLVRTAAAEAIRYAIEANEFQIWFAAIAPDMSGRPTDPRIVSLHIPVGEDGDWVWFDTDFLWHLKDQLTGMADQDRARLPALRACFEQAIAMIDEALTTRAPAVRKNQNPKEL